MSGNQSVGPIVGALVAKLKKPQGITVNVDFMTQAEQVTQVAFDSFVGYVPGGMLSQNTTIKNISLDDALAPTLVGQHVLFNVPLGRLKHAMRTFRCNQYKNGSNCATACFIVPSGPLFAACTSAMLVCGDYAACDVYCAPVSAPNCAPPVLYLPTCRQQLVYCQKPYVDKSPMVYTRLLHKPEVRAQSGMGSTLPLQFVGHVGGANGPQHTFARILMDCGATHSFIDLTLVHKMGLSLQPSAHNNTSLANGAHTSIVGEVKLSLLIQGVVDTVPCLVMQCMIPNFDLILGNDWLIQNDALLSPRHKLVHINPKLQKYVLYAVDSLGFQAELADAADAPAAT